MATVGNFVKFAIGALVLMTSVQVAEARPSTPSFTCAGLKEFIRSRGAVVMNTKNQYVYRRFVEHRGFCMRDETTRLYTVPAKDGKCRLKICVEVEDDDDFFWWW